MPEWKALNVGVKSKDVAQDQNPKFVRVNSMSIWAKLQNTGPLLKRVSLEWLGGSPVSLTGKPPSYRATELHVYTFFVLQALNTTGEPPSHFG